MSHGYAQVAINIPLDRTFDYEIPAWMQGRVRPGVIVRVPFGPRRVLGYCVGTSERPDFERTRPIQSVVEEEPVFWGKDLELARWIASQYAAGLGEVLEAMLPAAVRKGRSTPGVEFVKLTLGAEESCGQLDAAGGRRQKQRAILDALIDAGGDAPLAEVLSTAGASRTSLKRLVEMGLAAVEKRSVNPWESLVADGPPEELQLTPAQRNALEEIIEPILNRRFQTFLLLGVTGSGKTEVYLRAIERVVAAGRQAIVLIPEIVLTPQTVSRFLRRFRKVAVLHSHLTDRERHAQWRAIARGEADVIIGARSAVFAPARNVGIIVIDEEHETSFKQDNSPRYHAREVALHRARLGDFPLVLGSATPSLESFHHAVRGDYRLLELPQRVEKRPLPEVHVVDMVEERAMRKGRFVLSRSLDELLTESLERGEQAMLFLNRRGFTTYLYCPRCGFVLTCGQCAVSLIFHKREAAAICHYCGHRTPVPDECPECHQGRVIQMGMGTERIEEDIRTLHPDSRIQRMDGDTMSKRGAHDEAVRRINEGEVDIVVGTQMIAKGHDFPKVTVVGVITADTALHFPDFRARERTFQLLTQVAGRTGRSDRGGRVVVQTHSPDDPSIRFASRHDYLGFAKAELADRKALGYPPFSRIVRVLIEGASEDDVAARSTELAGALRALPEDVGAQIMGPVPAPIARIKGRFRYHVLTKLPRDGDITHVTAMLSGMRSRRGKASVSIDVDPMNML